MGRIVLEVLYLTKIAVFFNVLLIISNQLSDVLHLHLVLEVVAYVLTHVGGRLECIEQPQCVLLDWFVSRLETYLFEIRLHVLIGHQVGEESIAFL